MKSKTLLNVVKNRFIDHFPFRVLHLITSKCNCRCKICDAWKKSPDYKNDLSTEEIFLMLEDVKNTGISFYTAMGGEPLIRKDLPVVLQYAKKLGLITDVVTNGFYLKERYNEILPYTDVLAVSIDSNDELHDEMRGVDGIRSRAIEGIKLCKNKQTKIIINSIITNANLNKIEGLLKLSKELDVSISFQPMDIYKEYNEKFNPTEEELQKAFSNIIDYKKKGYPIVNSFKYLQNFSNKKQYICHGPKCFINIESNGNISSCLNVHDKNWGNIKKIKLIDVFNSKEFRDFCKQVERCNVCNVSCAIESSIAYSLDPKFLFDKFFSYYFSYYNPLLKNRKRKNH